MPEAEVSPLAPSAPIPQPPAPPLGYWSAVLAEEDPADYRKMLREVGEEFGDDLKYQLTEGFKSAGYTQKAPPLKRLMFYLDKPNTIAEAQERGLQHSWESYQQRFPEWYEIDWQDFQDLRMRAERGEFN